MNEEEIKQIKKDAVEEYKKTTDFEMLSFMKNQQALLLNALTDKNKKNFYKKYSTEQVSNYLSDPVRYEKELRSVSRYLNATSPQYKSLMDYYPSIALIKPILIPCDSNKLSKTTKSLKKKVLQYAKILDNMNVDHEYKKIIECVVREDVFYGIEIETDSSYYIYQLNSDFCKITGVYDGVYTFSYDLSYFNNRPEELEYFNKNIDSKIKSAFNKFKAKNSDETKWFPLDINRQVCVKMQETLPFCCPPYIATFKDLYDIEDYKALNKAGVELQNSRIVNLKMPYDVKSGEVDKWLLSPDTMKAYFQFASNILQGQMATILTPFDAQVLSDKAQNNDNTDVIGNAIKTFWGGAGIPEVLLGENKTAGTLKYSIVAGESKLFKLYRQLERLLSRKIKLVSNGMFKVMLPDVTTMSVKLENDLDNWLKLSQYGYKGARTIASAIMGISQNQAEGLGILENEVFDLPETMIPVSSSYTQSSGDVGANEKDENDLSDSGVQTRDDDENANK